MRAWVRSHPFLSYYVVALALASTAVAVQSAYAAEFLRQTGREFQFNQTLWDGLKTFGHGRLYANLISIWWVATHRQPVYFTVFLFGGAPTIAAIVVITLNDGWAGLGRWIARLKPWPSRAFRGPALITYAVLAAAGFGLALAHLAVIGVAKGWDEALRDASVWGMSAWLLPLGFLIGGVIDEGGTSEEMGWRGFALPTLLARMGSPLRVALFLGFLWWLWHFPREIPDIMAGKTVWAQFIPGQLIFMLLVIAMSVVMTFCFHRTGGSVIPSILIHGWGNFASKAVGIYDIVKTDDRLWLFFAASIAIIVFAGPQLGRGAYQARLSTPTADSPTKPL